MHKAEQTASCFIFRARAGLRAGGGAAAPFARAAMAGFLLFDHADREKNNPAAPPLPLRH